MRKILLLAGVTCFAAANASAFDFNPYVAAKAKYVFARNEAKVTGSFEGKGKLNDEVWGGSIAAGNIFNVINGDFRIEVEYTKNGDAKKDGGKIKTQGVLFNAYYDFDLRTAIPVTPYVGVGLGWGRTEISGGNEHIKESGAAMQIGAGINYRIYDRTSIDFGYRYITYGDFEKKYHAGVIYEKTDYKPRAHELLLGVRYDF
ncbi:MAG: porin family protein [Alphaproteobacteria bacterium]|nr:porin family protein [Alphaproteobacteria bacterium]